MKNFSLQFLIGKNSLTKENQGSPFALLEKQLSLSIPLITGMNITFQKKKKKWNQKVYVGRELKIQELQKNPNLLEKYNINIEELADIAVEGYQKVCVLNYKKYDSVLVGVNDEDLIVPDYFALKKYIYVLKENVS